MRMDTFRRCASVPARPGLESAANTPPCAMENSSRVSSVPSTHITDRVASCLMTLSDRQVTVPSKLYVYFCSRTDIIINSCYHAVFNTPSVLWYCWLGGRKGIQPAKNGGWCRWALVSPDEWRPAGWSVCLPLLIFPCAIKSRSSLLALANPGGPGIRAVKWLWWWCGFNVPCFGWLDDEIATNEASPFQWLSTRWTWFSWFLFSPFLHLSSTRTSGDKQHTF